MSLILDALRKMEQERKTRRRESVNIRPEVLSYRAAPQQPSTNRPVLIGIGVILVLGCVIAGLLFMMSKPRSAPLANISEPGLVKPSAVALPPLTPAKPAPLAEQGVTATMEKRDPLPLPVQSPAEMPGNRPDREASAGAVPLSGNANLQISGIAWQEERGLRRAVINGMLIGEGGEVAGAQIVEIKENRVKFSRAGQTFEVICASAFSPR